MNDILFDVKELKKNLAKLSLGIKKGRFEFGKKGVPNLREIGEVEGMNPFILRTVMYDGTSIFGWWSM